MFKKSNILLLFFSLLLLSGCVLTHSSCKDLDGDGYSDFGSSKCLQQDSANEDTDRAESEKIITEETSIIKEHEQHIEIQNEEYEKKRDNVGDEKKLSSTISIKDYDALILEYSNQLQSLSNNIINYPSYCFVNGKDECAEMWYYFNRIATDDYSYICNYAPDTMGWSEGYKLNGLASAYAATQDLMYLDIMRADINVLFCIKDDISNNDCAVCPFTYQKYGDNTSSVPPEWGWYGDTYSATPGVKHDYFVTEGLLAKGIVRFVDFVKSDPVLQAEYGVDADIYLERVENLFDKWDRRGLFKEIGDGSGVYVYPNDSHVQGGGKALMSLPHNQQDEWAGAMIALYRITGDVKYRDRAAKLLYHLKKNYYYETNILNWDYWNHAGLWDYKADSSTVIRGGLRHSEFMHDKCQYKRIESEAMIEGWMNCLVFEDEDMDEVMSRLDIHSVIPYTGYDNCAYPAYMGFYEDSRLVNTFNKLRTWDDGLSGNGLPWRTLYKLEVGHFFEVLFDTNPMQFVCDKKDIPIYQNFNGATTNFRGVPEITDVTEVVLEKSNFGKIEFGAKQINMANLFLDAYVDIAQNLVIIDGQELPNLDVPATVTLYNVKNENPQIKKGKVSCSECKILSAGKDVTFTIPGAGNYMIEPQNQLLFNDDFESGNFNKWPVDNGKGKISVTSEQSRTGSMSMKVLFDGKTEMFMQSPDFNVEDYWYKISFMLSNDFVLAKNAKFSLGDAAFSDFGKNVIVIHNIVGANITPTAMSSDIKLYLEYSDDLKFKHWIPQNKRAGIVLERGRWYDVEYHFMSDPGGFVDLYVNGNFIGRSTMGDNVNSKQRAFALGAVGIPDAFWSGSARGTLYLDNFEIYEMVENQ